MTDKQLYKQARQIAGEMEWKEVYNGVDSIHSQVEDRISTHDQEELEFFEDTIANQICEG